MRWGRWGRAGGTGEGAAGSHRGAGRGQGHGRQLVDDAGAGEQHRAQPVICRGRRGTVSCLDPGEPAGCAPPTPHGPPPPPDHPPHRPKPCWGVPAPLTQLDRDDAATQGGAEVADHLEEGGGGGLLGPGGLRATCRGGSVAAQAADLVRVGCQPQQLLGFGLLWPGRSCQGSGGGGSGPPPGPGDPVRGPPSRSPAAAAAHSRRPRGAASPRAGAARGRDGPGTARPAAPGAPAPPVPWCGTLPGRCGGWRGQRDPLPAPSVPFHTPPTAPPSAARGARAPRGSPVARPPPPAAGAAHQDLRDPGRVRPGPAPAAARRAKGRAAHAPGGPGLPPRTGRGTGGRPGYRGQAGWAGGGSPGTASRSERLGGESGAGADGGCRPGDGVPVTGSR